MKEVELAARLFHSANIDELMACLNEHPAPTKTPCQSRQTFEHMASLQTPPTTLANVEVPAEQSNPTDNEMVRSN